MDDVILKMQGIVKVFAGVHALNNVQFELKRGEVHALIGENGAGKTTLMKILLGIHQADFGEIILNGNVVKFRTPAEALKNGISMIHQEISLVPDMEVDENIWLGRENRFMRGGFIDKKARYEQTKKLLDELGLNIDPTSKIKNISVANMQLVELARAVSYDSDIIIMDEPTSALTNREIELLYNIVRKLAKQGKAIIFISHKLEEIFDICQRVTVFRDGTYIATENCNEISMEKLISMIVGRKQNQVFEKKNYSTDEVMLEVRNFSQAGVFNNVNFAVRKGEVLGFAGLMGAGRTEMMQAIFGITKPTSGELYYKGRKVTIKKPSDAVAHKIGMVTEDRLRSGSIYSMSVMKNTTIVSIKKIANKLHLFTRRKEKSFFLKAAKDLEVKYSSHDELIGQLSGGNQQKVIFARWLSTKPEVLILDEPTRGIDVGSKAEIYRLIETLASQGMAILLVSSEMLELLALSDRINVVRNGEIVYECTHEEANQETLISYAFGVQEKV
jgi:ABC-type sugar transport system ATPase subunit